MREKITSDFNYRLCNLEISEKERLSFFKKYSISASIELIIYTVILLILAFNARAVSAISYMSLSSLLSSETIAGIILFSLLGLVIISALSDVILFGLSFSNKKRLKDTTYVKYHNITENIQFLLKGIFIIYLILTVIFSNARVDGPSMEESFHTNDHVLLWHAFYEPKDDDVIVAKITIDKYPRAYVDPGDSESYYIKRVVAVEGDSIKVSYDNGLFNLNVNGVFIEKLTSFQVYMLFNEKGEKDFETFIPTDKLIIMGDNRGNSTDSRTFGMLNTEDIMGKVIFRIYPFNSIGKIDKQIKE